MILAEGELSEAAEVPEDDTQARYGLNIQLFQASGNFGMHGPWEDQIKEAYKCKRAKYLVEEYRHGWKAH